jgi:hypothetical protein
VSIADDMAEDAKAAPQVAPTSLDQQMAADLAAHQSSPDKVDYKQALGSDWQNFAAGAGEQAVGLGRRLVQLGAAPAQWIEAQFPGLAKWGNDALGSPSAAEIAKSNQQEIDDAKRRDVALNSTKAGLAGNVAGGVASTMLPIAGLAKAGVPLAASVLNPATYAAAAGSGAVQGALQPVATGDSGTTNALMGAGLGVASKSLVNAVGRIAAPVGDALNAARDKAVQVLEDAGVNLDAAQKTGSAFLNKLRSSFSDNPFTANAQQAFVGDQKTAYNRAVLSTVGENADAATPEVMARAQDRINGVFADVLNRNNVKVDDPLLTKIGAAQAAASEAEQKPIVSVANRILSAANANDEIPGQIAYGIKKDLDQYASSADSTLAYHARQLRSALMDGINDSLSPTDQQQFAQARLQFGNLKSIEPTIDRMGNGDISPAKLANVMAQKRNRGVSIYGRGDQSLNDLAQAGNMLLRDPMPNSGTTSRLMMQAAPALIGGAFGGATSRDPEHPFGNIGNIAAGVAAGYAIPKLGQMAINSPAVANYLAKGLPGAAKTTLQLPQKNALVGGAVQRIPYEAEASQP